jgi:phosphatidylserine decarboxylase
MTSLVSEIAFLREQAWVSILRVAPLRMYTQLMGLLGDIPIHSRMRPLVWKIIAHRVGMNLSETELSLEDYATFHELFVRRLQPGCRPIFPGDDVLVSPVDGCLTAFGGVRSDMVIQAKGVDYSLSRLIGDSQLAEEFDSGTFLTLYLRPKDYHRIHCPLPATITRTQRIPGSLYPVKPYMTRNLRGLFTQNERLVLLLDSSLGKVLMVCVAAAGVGTISTSFGQENGRSLGKAGPIRLEKGEEIAVFHLGSTVILFFEPGRLALSELEPGRELLMGEALGRRAPLNHFAGQG